MNATITGKLTSTNQATTTTAKKRSMQDLGQRRQCALPGLEDKASPANGVRCCVENRLFTPLLPKDTDQPPGMYEVEHS